MRDKIVCVSHYYLSETQIRAAFQAIGKIVRKMLVLSRLPPDAVQTAFAHPRFSTPPQSGLLLYANAPSSIPLFGNFSVFSVFSILFFFVILRALCDLCVILCPFP